MEEQAAASGEESSVDPDHVPTGVLDTSNPGVDFDPQSSSQSGPGTSLEQGHVEQAVEMTVDRLPDQTWPHEEQMKVLLEDLQKLMPEKDFKNAECLVKSSRKLTPDERNSLLELLEYLKTNHRTPDKVRKTASSSSSSSLSMSMRYIVKVHPVVTGKTYGADEAILEQVKKRRWRSTTKVETTTDLQDCDIIILFCPIVTRVGPDVDAAIRNIAVNKKVILVLMHHTRYDDESVDEKKRWSDDLPNVVLYVHILFHETLPGLLKCTRNKEAVKEIREELKKHSKNRLFNFR